jgi:hypothetical protein
MKRRARQVVTGQRPAALPFTVFAPRESQGEAAPHADGSKPSHSGRTAKRLAGPRAVSKRMSSGAAWLSLLAPVSGMTRRRAWAIIDPWIAGRRRVFSVTEAVVALDWMLFHRLPGSIRGKRWVGLERKNDWCRVRGFLEKRSPRFVMLALCVHLIPRNRVKAVRKRWWAIRRNETMGRMS